MAELLHPPQPPAPPQIHRLHLYLSTFDLTLVNRDSWAHSNSAAYSSSTPFISPIGTAPTTVSSPASLTTTGPSAVTAVTASARSGRLYEQQQKQHHTDSRDLDTNSSSAVSGRYANTPVEDIDK